MLESSISQNRDNTLSFYLLTLVTTGTRMITTISYATIDKTNSIIASSILESALSLNSDT